MDTGWKEEFHSKTSYQKVQCSKLCVECPILLCKLQIIKVSQIEICFLKLDFWNEQKEMQNVGHVISGFTNVNKTS